MEGLFSAGQPFKQKYFGNRKEEGDMKPDEKPQVEGGTSDEALTDQHLMTREALGRRNIWEPSVYYALGKESFHFAGQDISIRESMDTYGALIWPGAIALSQFLENNQEQMNVMDKAVLELGAGTGLVSIVASLLGKAAKTLGTSLHQHIVFELHLDSELHSEHEEGIIVKMLQCKLRLSGVAEVIGVCNSQKQLKEGLIFEAEPFCEKVKRLKAATNSCAWVTATDQPEILSNLTFNLRRNTKGRSRYTPQVAALSWGQDLERHFPYLSCHYDYVLAADVIYHHDFLEELLKTMLHFCRPGSGTTLLLANKIRFQSDLRFIESFKSRFNTMLLTELPQQEVRIYKATAKE